MNAQQYAVSLEHLLRSRFPNANYDADSFQIHPDDTMETFWGYLEEERLIEKGAPTGLCEKYNFGGQTLREFLQQPGAEETLEELLDNLRGILSR